MEELPKKKLNDTLSDSSLKWNTEERQNQEVFRLRSSSTNLVGALPCGYRETEHRAEESEACSFWKESLQCRECLLPEGCRIKMWTDVAHVSYCALSLVSAGFSASASAVGTLCWTLPTFLSTAKKCIRKSLICDVSAGPSAALTGMKQINS